MEGMADLERKLQQEMSFPVAALIDAPSSSSQTGKDAAASLGGTGPFLAEVGTK